MTSAPKAFCTEHGDPGRRGRVDAPRRRYLGFERLVLPPDQTAKWPITPQLPVRYIAVDPSGQRVVLVHEHCAVVVEPYGARLLYGAEFGRWLALTRDDALYFGPQRHPWSGERPTQISSLALLLDNEQRTQVSLACTPHGWISAVASEPLWDEPELRIEARRVVEERHATAWRARLPALGLSAVADDGSIALLTREGLHLYAAVPDTKKATPTVTRPTAANTYLVSAAKPGWVVLAAVRTETGDVHTLVQAWHPDGRDAWSVTVPFALSQPPVECADGSLLAVGYGIARIRNGAVQPVRSLDVRAFATAFGDGSIALARGTTLEIMDDGHGTLQKLRVPDGESIVTQPAIGPDGTIYVGTPTRCYVLR